MQKSRILIVEDEAIITMEIESQLQSLGYEVTSIVDTGEKAIKKAEDDKPDLILMDIRIKGEMDGIEAAEEIRDRFGIPVIFSTAYLDQERIDRAKITMPFGYVLKPIQERDLKVTLEMALYVAKADEERRKAEEIVQESEKQYRQMFEDNTAIKLLIDPEEGSIINANKAACEFYGYCWENLMQMKITDINALPSEKVEEEMKNAKTEKRKFFLFKHILSTGQIRDVEVYSGPITRRGKNLLFSIIHDITNRKQVEDALRESEEKHRTLFETMSQGVVYQNAEGIITDANPAAERILGLSLNQLQGKTSMDPRWKTIHEDGSDFPGETHPISVVLRTGKTVKNVIQGVFHPDKKEYRWISINAVPKYRKGESTPYEAYAIFDDITDLRIGKK